MEIFVTSYIDEWLLNDILFELQNTPLDTDLTIQIASNGGEINPAFAIANFLQRFTNLKTNVLGQAYSSAVIIALSAKKENRTLSSGAEIMVHNASMFGQGEAKDFEKGAEILQAQNERIADYYVTRMGGDKQTYLNLMNDTTFMSASKAVELGFFSKINESIINFNQNKMTKVETMISELNSKVTNLFDKFKIKNEGDANPDANKQSDANNDAKDDEIASLKAERDALLAEIDRLKAEMANAENAQNELKNALSEVGNDLVEVQNAYKAHEKAMNDATAKGKTLPTQSHTPAKNTGKDVKNVETSTLVKTKFGAFTMTETTAQDLLNNKRK